MEELEALKDVDKWSRYILIFGYIRSIEQSMHESYFHGLIPNVIIFLCLSYSTEFYLKDCFEDFDDDIFEISDDKLTIKNIKGATWHNHSIFGKEPIDAASDNIYRWVLNIHSDDILIGICAMTKMEKSGRVNKDFTKSPGKALTSYGYYRGSGAPYYAFDSDGGSFTNRKMSIHTQDAWEFGKGDQIVLLLHFEWNRVYLEIKGEKDKQFLIFKDIDRSYQYYLVLQMPEKDDFVTILHPNPC